MIDNPLARLTDGVTASPVPTGPVTNFAVVTSTSPLKIRLAGDDDPLEGSPPVSLVSGLKVGHIVRVEFNGRQLIITGRVDGDPTDTRKRADLPPWRTPTLRGGWEHYSSFGDLQYRRIGDEVQFRGVIRNGTQVGSANPFFYVESDCIPTVSKLLTARISAVAIQDIRMGTDGGVASHFTNVPEWFAFEGVTYYL